MPDEPATVDFLLCELAVQRGVTFVVPTTRSEAERLIDELKRRAPEPIAERRREIRAVQDDLATGRGDAARVREQLEVTGYGSNCRWSH
jgi:hypothetical protein